MQSEKFSFEIKLEGYSNFDWSAVFEDVTVEHTEDGQTILTGSVADQTALHSVLMRIRDLGLSLVEVKRVIPPAG